MSRRRFLRDAALAGAAGFALPSVAPAAEKVMQGFEEAPLKPDASKGWKPVSDRKVRVGIVGYGASKFGALFGFQSHPNVEVVAVSDLFPDRCEALAKACRCSKTYPSLEELVKDDRIEAVFVATDAPSHARHCLEVLRHGKDVAVAVPAAWGSLEDAHAVFEEVKRSGRKYMMFETSYFHDDLHAMRQIYQAGGFGKIIYSEGEYYHYSDDALPSYKGWRIGGPPQWYPTHANAYHLCVTGESYTEVSCLGTSGRLKRFQKENNVFKNPFGTEIALFRASQGGLSRMVQSRDSQGWGAETGRIRGEKAAYSEKYIGPAQPLPDLSLPPLPPGVAPGGHGGSHGHLMNEFVTAILQNRTPAVHVAMAMNLTVSGIIAHQSALKNGELLKIPQFKL
jgi:predicted dehydrogenase